MLFNIQFHINDFIGTIDDHHANKSKTNLETPLPSKTKLMLSNKFTCQQLVMAKYFESQKILEVKFSHVLYNPEGWSSCKRCQPIFYTNPEDPAKIPKLPIHIVEHHLKRKLQKSIRKGTVYFLDCCTDSIKEGPWQFINHFTVSHHRRIRFSTGGLYDVEFYISTFRNCRHL